MQIWWRRAKSSDQGAGTIIDIGWKKRKKQSCPNDKEILSSGIPWNMPRVTRRLKARVCTENTSNAWHIPRYPTRKHCITSIHVL